MIIGMPQKEYDDISNNLRHYGNFQFTQLTVFAVINIAMIKLVFDDTKTAHSLKIILAIIGLLLSLSFLVMTKRITAHWTSYSKRAIELKKNIRL